MKERYHPPVDGLFPDFAPVQLAFYKAPGNFIDKAIRWGSNSIYSHVELIGPEGLGWSSSSREGCVRVKDINFNSGSWDIVELPWMDTHLACGFIEPELGKGYDYVGVVKNHMLSMNRSHPDKWFCSEVVAMALGLPDPHLYSPGSLSKTVQHLTTFRKAMLTPPKGDE